MNIQISSYTSNYCIVFDGYLNSIHPDLNHKHRKCTLKLNSLTEFIFILMSMKISKTAAEGSETL